MKRLVILLSALAVLAWPMVASAGPNEDSARGRVNFSSTQVSFSASSTPNGLDASGRITYTQTSLDPNQTYKGEVTCLEVVGATPGGSASFYAVALVTDAPPGSFVQSIHVTGSDSGKFGQAPDTLTAFTSFLPPPGDGSCPASFQSSPVADGEVIVHNALP